MSKKGRRRHGNRNNTAERRRRQERTTQRTWGCRVLPTWLRPPSMLPRWRRVELWQNGNNGPATGMGPEARKRRTIEPPRWLDDLLAVCPACSHINHQGRCPVVERQAPGVDVQCPCTHQNGVA
jgi:hypothetical protein